MKMILHSQMKHFFRYQITWYGTSGGGADSSRRKRPQRAYKPSMAKVEEIEKQELQRSKRLKIKRQQGIKRQQMGIPASPQSREDRNKDLMREITQILSRRGFEETNVEQTLRELGATKVEKKSFHEDGEDLGKVRQSLDDLKERALGNPKQEAEVVDEDKERVDVLYTRLLEDLEHYLDKKERKKEMLSLADRYLNHLLDKNRDKEYGSKREISL